MPVIPGIAALDRSLGRLFIVVGVFDGLHRGHLYLLRALRRAARRAGARPAVITFDHHPDEILTGHAPPLLCDPEERLQRLARAGVAVTVVQHFDAALRATPYDVFLRSIAERVELAGILMTPDAAFGHDRGGTPATVAELGRSLGYATEIVPPLELDGHPVRSAEIRAAISSGDFARARRLLGRAVTVTGRSRTHDGATTLLFDLPVALPPAGDRPAVVEIPGRPSALRRRLRIEPRRVRLVPGVDVPEGTRLRVRLPVAGEPATIRRS
jgi:FAD synthase